MDKKKIEDVFNEPGCSKNAHKSEKERKKGCSKPLKPGAAAGGCAFDGAKIALQPVTDVVHLVHGPIACEGNSWDNRGSLSSGKETYRMGFTTDMEEFDVIYGGEKKLYRSIKEIINKYNPPAIFVYQTCVPSLIGDDVERVCKLAREKFNVPVVPVNAPGFSGSKNLGNKLAGEALLDYVIGTEEPEYLTDRDINLIGEYNLAGELWQIKRLLEKMGVRVLATISGDARYRDIASCHRARVNMLVCSKAMINVARKMQERYGIPYFEGSFYGISDTGDSLRNIARLLVERGADETLIKTTEDVIAEEESKIWHSMQKYSNRLRKKRVLIITGGVKSWSVVSALKEIGMDIIGTSVKKSTFEDRERIQKALGEDANMIENFSQKELFQILKKEKADMLMSGGRTQFVALKAKVPWLDINQERHEPYACYDGMLNLVRMIDAHINNNMWKSISANPFGDK